MTIASPDAIRIGSTDTRYVTVGFNQTLDTGVNLTLTGVVEVSTSDLTISSAAVNTATVDIEQNGETVTVEIGQAIQFLVSGGTAGKTYKVRITATTDESPAQTITYDQQLEFV